ncbi:PREDICTED: A-agglutinin anchorage subunit-like [Branchiostoma belcheri]|uniref:A-agglutinin anchorage subunit-like n=1 Tax=Branchiostoma belcheri TaxID=7741 RepID=A0A6P4Z1C4_BRABE|nr:PREDICTED: A-agglutinin anchorage subunit-like [Branchiostoma belcheri]
MSTANATTAHMLSTEAPASTRKKTGTTRSPSRSTKSTRSVTDITMATRDIQTSSTSLYSPRTDSKVSTTSASRQTKTPDYTMLVSTVIPDTTIPIDNVTTESTTKAPVSVTDVTSKQRTLRTRVPTTLKSTDVTDFQSASTASSSNATISPSLSPKTTKSASPVSSRSPYNTTPMSSTLGSKQTTVNQGNLSTEALDSTTLIEITDTESPYNATATSAARFTTTQTKTTLLPNETITRHEDVSTLTSYGINFTTKIFRIQP